MIRHIVLLRFRSDVSADTKRMLFAELADLRGHLHGIVDFRVGPNVSPETPVIHGFHEGFWVDFVDAAARDAYLDDPAHKAVGARLVAHADGGLSGILVFDMTV